MSYEQLDLELDHIFESGANQERIKTLINLLISKVEIYVLVLNFKAESNIVHIGTDKAAAEKIALKETKYNSILETWVNGQYKTCENYVKGVLVPRNTTDFPF